jgi:small-conductance mechanosensitive channel
MVGAVTPVRHAAPADVCCPATAIAAVRREVPSQDAMTGNGTRAARRGWIVGGIAGVLALAALVSGSAFGTVSPPTNRLNPRLIAWSSAGVLLVFGAVATTRLSKMIARHVSTSSMPSAGGAVRIITAAVGYLIVVFGVLAVLKVSIEHLLVGAGLAGIVLGIAAQQSLGNVFAGLVLILARPFHVGDRVRVRSGALGGIFDARVREMTLTYVTLQTEDGDFKVPNSAMLAAGVARTPRTPLPQPAPPSSPAKPADADPAGPAPAAGGGPARAAGRAEDPGGTSLAEPPR